MKKKLKFALLIPLAVSALVFALSNLDFYKTLVYKLNDLLLHVKPPMTEDSRLLFLDIDDGTLEKTSSWPISRRYMAEGLILLKEFNAAYTLFDIEYIDPRPHQFNEDELREGIEQVISLARQKKESDLTAHTAQVFINNDLYLGQAARMFGNAFFTVRTFKEADESRKFDEQYEAMALEKIRLKDIVIRTDNIPAAVGIQPPIPPVMAGGKGAGFVNSEYDDDGVLRRADLLIKYKDTCLPQLAFASLLDLMGQPTVIVEANRIILKGAHWPPARPSSPGQAAANNSAQEDTGEQLDTGDQLDTGEKQAGRETRDIIIPLDEKNKLLINWSQKTFIDSFAHLPYWQLILHKELEKRLLANLEVMQAKGYLYAFREGTDLVENYHTIEDILADILASGQAQASGTARAYMEAGAAPVDESQIEMYREARTVFFEDVKEFLFGPAEADLLQEIDQELAGGRLKPAEKELYQAVRGSLPQEFAKTREVFKELEKARTILSSKVPGSLCLIGHTSTSTEDIGVTPFDKSFMNVGLHINILNTILSGRFISIIPMLFIWLAAALLAFILTIILQQQEPLPTILIGFAFLVLLMAGSVFFIMQTNYLFDLLAPFLTIFLTFFSLSLVKFMLLAKEKTFLRNAFSHYLASEVINELIVDPSKLQLGGDKRYLTTIFTDIKGFSTISEQLDPTDLVKLLNTYLTEMSNIILELRGTIDKYEGDAIIAFFGAPVTFDDHARRACLAAIRMKKIEAYLNEHLVAQKLTPAPLLTRIGINTGDMVVGNMGTQKKFDYTVMGHAVNLAARLEGVNKQYGTWAMISENTYLECGIDFFLRMLDKVRVVGVQNPVRLYELIDEKSLVTPQVKEGVEIFHAGMQQFEKRSWDKAQELFTDTLRLIPGDGPSSILYKRCEKYKLEPPPENWDNVFNLSVK